MLCAENELTASWSWVLVGIALSQVIGGPIAAGGNFNMHPIEKMHL